MNDRVLQVRQIAQYKRVDAAIPGTLVLLQYGDIGSPYASILASDLVTSALAASGDINLSAANGAINFLYDQGAGSLTLSVENGELLVRPAIRTSTLNAAFVNASGVVVNGDPVVTVSQLAADRAASVTSFNFRSGDVMLMEDDIKRAGGAPIRDAHFGGWITAPSVWDTRANDDTVATTNWVHRAIHDTGVSSFNGRSGDITLTTADISAATAAGPGYPTAPSPPLGDASNRIATTLFVDESLQDLHLTITDEQLALLMTTYAPINSPQLTGIPTAPTANPGTHTGQLATTAFVMNAVSAATSGVSSFNTRTGAVLLNTADITGAGGAILASPAFSGTPTAPTAAPGTSTIQLATTAFVGAAVTAAGGVTSFNTRTGAVTLSLADVTGTGVLSNTALAGIPTAPTAAPGTSTTQVATTAFVSASVAASVTSFMSRTGAVTLTGADVSAAGGALNASPTFTGTPTAPTAAPGTNTTQLATTAFVQAALASMTAGVTTFNGRTGAVTLTAADITGASGVTTAMLTTSPLNLAGWTLSVSAATTWNPADTSANMTLSNGNLTATSTNFSVGTRAAAGLNSGKSYFEVTMANGASTADGIGIGLASASLAATLPVGTAGVAPNSIFVNGVSVLAFPGITNGSIIGIAVDLTAQLIWFRIAPSGNWNNSGTANPATGTGGVSISSISSGALYPIYQVGAATGHSATANFGASAFSGAVPSGFISGWGTGISVAAGTGAGGDQITSQGSLQLVPGSGGTVQAPTMPPGNNSTAVATTAFVAAAVPVLRSYLAGLGLSTAGSSATFAVAAGVAADTTNVRMMVLASALAKTTSAWAAGNNNGGLDTGAIAASTWYHVHLIMRTDTNVVDALVSLSASAPTLPSPYTLFRRIGSMKTNASSQWTLFTQLGEEFLWSVPVLEINGVAVPTTPTLITLAGVPTGLQLRARVRVFCSGTADTLVQSPDEASAQANASGAGVDLGLPTSGRSAANLIIRTSTSAQVRWSAVATGSTSYITCFGWLDSRGRDA